MLMWKIKFMVIQCTKEQICKKKRDGKFFNIVSQSFCILFFKSAYGNSTSSRFDFEKVRSEEILLPKLNFKLVLYSLRSKEDVKFSKSCLTSAW